MSQNITDKIIDQGLIKERQLMLLRQQQIHLREIGQNQTLGNLALRARFVFKDSAAEVASSENDEALNRDARSLLPLRVCIRFNVLPENWTAGVLTIRSVFRLTETQKQVLMESCSMHSTALKVIPIGRAELIQKLREMGEEGSTENLLKDMKEFGTDSNRLRRLVYTLLRDALELRASDIHLYKKPDPDAWVTFRIDSIMTPTYLLPETLMQAVVARIKIESGMDASNVRSAQDGRLELVHRDRSIDFRVSSQPLVDGESMVLRVLDASRLPGLASVFPGQPKITGYVQKILRVTGKTGGLVLMSGATGSGKSTTLYTMACGFERDSLNVVTVEDPVEYSLPFAKQIQLQALLKQKAVELERSILRQDPDILIFGEIRDADSARAALAFAESGHLVISTIHANGVLQVSERFLSIIHGDHREDAHFLLANYLRVVLHQKLVPKLCDCAAAMPEEKKIQVISEAYERTRGVIDLEVTDNLREAVGCSACNGLGYKGRLVAHETMVIPSDGEDRDLFSQAYREHRLNLTSDLNKSNGIDYISRQETFCNLLKIGLMDWPSVLKQIKS